MSLRPEPRTTSLTLDPRALILDPCNPRLLLPPKAPPDVVMQALVDEEDLDELALSMSSAGYFEEEPLVVVRADTDAATPGAATGQYLVVEGNRRAATIMLLLSEELRQKFGKSYWPAIADEFTDDFRKIPCVLYGSRDDVTPYLGFRHITGIRKWSTFARARYVNALVESGMSFDKIERSVGDGARVTRRLYLAYKMFETIQEIAPEFVPRVRERFSLLEVLLGQTSIKTYWGLPGGLPSAKIDSSLARDKSANVKEVIIWVYGNPTDNTEPVVVDSRDISKKLAPVVDDDEAREHLRTYRNLDESFKRTGGELKYVLRTLRSETQNILVLAASVRRFRGDPDVEAAISGLENATQSLSKLV